MKKCDDAQIDGGGKRKWGEKKHVGAKMERGQKEEQKVAKECVEKEKWRKGGHKLGKVRGRRFIW